LPVGPSKVDVELGAAAEQARCELVGVHVVALAYGVGGVAELDGR
jgi:hypothetical protein